MSDDLNKLAYSMGIFIEKLLVLNKIGEPDHRGEAIDLLNMAAVVEYKQGIKDPQGQPVNAAIHMCDNCDVQISTAGLKIRFTQVEFATMIGHLAANDRIGAIKLVRNKVNGITLRDAKDFVVAWYSHIALINQTINEIKDMLEKRYGARPVAPSSVPYIDDHDPVPYDVTWDNEG